MVKERTFSERLAIVYPKAIGDFIFALPALHTIRRALPEAHITLVIKKKQAPLAEPQKGVLCDEVIALGGDMSWRRVRRRLAELRVDTVVDMAGNDQSGLLLAWRGGRRLRPHRDNCKGICALYSLFAESMPRVAPGTHRVDELLSFAHHVCGADPLHSFRLELPPAAVKASEAMIERFSLRSGEVVALNIGASRDTKRWPAAHFKTLAEGLIERGLRVVLMGAATFKSDGHYDRHTIAQFREQGLVDDKSCVDLISDDTLSPVVHLQRDTHFLRYSGVPLVVVGNDTGAMHIAGSVGEDAQRKTVSLFGPTHWGRYAPYDPSHSYPDKPDGEWNRVLCADVDCLPTGDTEACRCYRRGCGHKRCMTELHPDRVLAAVMDRVKT
ncbi:MAG: glycosyltransferase family 9 protein [Verrucomicrobia bacterium]|nr:glycosyltransferase family 9 protein [Verrucomicrobiota bacterium]MBT7701603.1 glycosyltransferase family 9 protein [Verrucomicrobiota bacterium]